MGPPSERDPSPDAYPDDDVGASDLSRLLVWVVFIGMVFAPAVVAGYRVVIAGLRNAPLSGHAPSGTPPLSSDLVLWVTASLSTLAVVLLGTLVVIEAFRGRFLISGVVLALIAIGPAAFNWYLILG